MAWPLDGPDSLHLKITLGAVMILARRLCWAIARVSLHVERVRSCGVFAHDQREVSVVIRVILSSGGRRGGYLFIMRARLRALDEAIEEGRSVGLAVIAGVVALSGEGG